MKTFGSNLPHGRTSQDPITWLKDVVYLNIEFMFVTADTSQDPLNWSKTAASITSRTCLSRLTHPKSLHRQAFVSCSSHF
jgi:hypothetical protein